MSFLDNSTLQQLALLAHVNGNEHGRTLYNVTTGAFMLINLNKKFKKTTKADILRAAAINAVTEFVKKHPNASDEQLAAEVTRQISEFVRRYRS